MAYAKLKTKIGVAEYIEGEEISPIRHEYLYGEVYAMAGASQNHNLIAGNLFSSLRNNLESSECQPYTEGMKVKAAESVFYYPDVLVTCEGKFKNPYFCEAPVLIVEITSPSTVQIDRREKLFAYQKMPSVHELIMVDQDKIAVEIHRRQDDGRWITYYFDDTDTEFTLKSVDLTLQLSDVYRRVVFETAQ